MDELVRQLAESEIALGFALAHAALTYLRGGDLAPFHQARQRAESTYLRAQNHVSELPEALRPTVAVHLEQLRNTIDQLPAQTTVVPPRSESGRQTASSIAESLFTEVYG
jgi:hypothetical protein